MLGRLCAAGLLLAPLGCRPSGAPAAPDRGGAAASVGPAPTTAVAASPAELVAAADRALEEDRPAEAVALFGRALAGDAVDDEITRLATLGLARAHERLHDCGAVIRAYDAYLERFPAAADRVIVHAHRGACEAELGQWEASAASFGEVATADAQLPSTRVEALARQGYALFNLDRFDDADLVLARADEVFERAQREQSERFSTYYFVGMARFYRGAILHRRFRDITIALPENVMAERFKQKLALLTRAQEAYNEAIKAKHMFWVSASGFQLGNLFGEFYDALMYAPVPEWLDDKQRRVYYEELKKQLRPVVDKAIWVLEKNLETARRLGYESEFTAQTEVKLSHLQSVLGSGDAGLGQPHVRLVGEPIPADASVGELAATGPEIERPTPGAGPADRKLFIPPMTPLLP
jgi:tetratricopeptide (TPR) repeat protein